MEKIWLFLLGMLIVIFRLHGQEKSIVVVIPSYNNQEWCEQNLGSALSQDYHNFRIIYIEDASTDETRVRVESYIKKWDRDHRVTLLCNEERMGSLANTYRGVWQCQTNEIVVILDGDDWFAHPQVLKKLNEVYSDADVWASYGQLRYYPGDFPGWVSEISPETIRHYENTHLRTFYAGLFHKIALQDLLLNQQFFSVAGDLAYMWPILEMAGSHSRFISDVLYVYNVGSSLNDSKINPHLQIYLTSLIRAKKPYAPVASAY